MGIPYEVHRSIDDLPDEPSATKNLDKQYASPSSPHPGTTGAVAREALSHPAILYQLISSVPPTDLGPGVMSRLETGNPPSAGVSGRPIPIARQSSELKSLNSRPTGREIFPREGGPGPSHILPIYQEAQPGGGQADSRETMVLAPRDSHGVDEVSCLPLEGGQSLTCVD
jgi:hypothetical protein